RTLRSAKYPRLASRCSCIPVRTRRLAIRIARSARGLHGTHATQANASASGASFVPVLQTRTLTAPRSLGRSAEARVLSDARGRGDTRGRGRRGGGDIFV